MDNVATAAIDYRLNNIEQTLAELKDVVIETRLQQKDIHSLMEKQEEILNAINSHDRRIRELEQSPAKNKAAKWQIVSDTVFKGVLGAILAIVLVKIGLK